MIQSGVTSFAPRSFQDPVVLRTPRVLAFGVGTFASYLDEVANGPSRRVFVVCSRSTRAFADDVTARVRSAGGTAVVWDDIVGEPTVRTFVAAAEAARSINPDTVVGIGGGSPLDVAKLVAALWERPGQIDAAFGINKLANPRRTALVCIPTTSGTGSEVSPNAILLDERDLLKKGVISPHLVPDATYADPSLTRALPAVVTAATGMDALTHCIEAYANKLAHPVVDAYAIEGIRLIASSLATAVTDGHNLDARSRVMLGSLYGGMCLGPVNTGAVHALAYPLGGEFRIGHGVSNSVLLPHVLEYNLPAAPQRYAEIAVAMGCKVDDDASVTAQRGLDRIRDLSRSIGIPQSLRELNIPYDAIDRLATSAMTVTRLLDRNVRTVTHADAVSIYQQAFSCS